MTYLRRAEVDHGTHGGRPWGVYCWVIANDTDDASDVTHGDLADRAGSDAGERASREVSNGRADDAHDAR